MTRLLSSLVILGILTGPQDRPRLRFRSVTAGATHSCAVTATVAYCWGDNGYGQLGTGNEQASSLPVPVTGGVTFASVSAGDGFTCGVSTAGDGYCWGRNTYERSNSGRPRRADTPTVLPGGASLR